LRNFETCHTQPTDSNKGKPSWIGGGLTHKLILNPIAKPRNNTTASGFIPLTPVDHEDSGRKAHHLLIKLENTDREKDNDPSAVRLLNRRNKVNGTRMGAFKNAYANADCPDHEEKLYRSEENVLTRTWANSP
jgi:hypothetical protein